MACIYSESSPKYEKILEKDIKNEYKSLGEVFNSILKTDGAAGFYRGLAPTMIRSFPTNAVCFLFYELTMSYLS